MNPLPCAKISGDSNDPTWLPYGAENSNQRLSGFEAGSASAATMPWPSTAPVEQSSPGFAGTSKVTAAPGGAGIRPAQSSTAPASAEPPSGAVIAPPPEGVGGGVGAPHAREHNRPTHHPAQRMPGPSRTGGWASAPAVARR